jgi:hypothetical protein
MTMHKLTQRWLVTGLLAVAPAVFAQQAPAPAAPAPTRQAPPPEDLEPGVNTSAMPANTQPPGPAPAAAPASKSATGNNSSAAASGSGAAPEAAAPKAGKTSKSSKPAKPDAAAAPAATRSNSGAGAKGGKAEDHLQLDTTQITGNQELPKVLYIVPWKRSDLGDMLGKPANSLLDEVLQPVDRDVFKRENRYYDALKPDAGGAAGKATGAAVQASGDKR